MMVLWLLQLIYLINNIKAMELTRIHQLARALDYSEFEIEVVKGQSDNILPICNINKLLLSYDDMYKELERKFNLGKHHEDGLPIDDTQIGWEKCFEWIIKANKD